MRRLPQVRFAVFSDFTALAKEAGRKHISSLSQEFSQYSKSKRQKKSMYYQGILAAKPSSQNLEEFYGSRQKEQIHFTISETDCSLMRSYRKPAAEDRNQKERMGYLNCHHLRCRVCTAGTDADYFGGFSGEYVCPETIVDYDRMHAGNNYAKITFSSVYERQRFWRFMRTKENKSPKNKKRTCQNQGMSVGLVELYEAFRLKKIVTGGANESVERLNQLHAMLRIR